jgi:hypothetical protein
MCLVLQQNHFCIVDILYRVYLARMFCSYLLLLCLQLQMLGYDISWAGFNIIEVMSSSKFTYKRIGYLSSSQSFHSDTEVSLLLISVQK